MLATIIHGERDIRLEEVPDPALDTSPDAAGLDAVVRVTAACVCGSGLWPYRGIAQVRHPRRMGHEWVGVVEQVGANVTTVQPGDFVIAPMYVCDGTCLNCRNHVSVSCQGEASGAPRSTTWASPTPARASGSGSRWPTAPWCRCPAVSPTPSWSRAC